MDNKIVEARIKPQFQWAKWFCIIFLILGVLIIIINGIPCRTIEGRYSNGEVYGRYTYNIFGEMLRSVQLDINGDIKKVREYSPGGSSLVAIVAFALNLLVVIYTIASNFAAKECRLTLISEGVEGTRKKIVSRKELKLPMNKIDSIVVQSGILDKIRGGQTIAIRSASGLIKFPWVQNAQEFVDTTLAEIQKYNEAAELKVKSAPAAAPAPASDDFEKIQKLKNLLDQGLLTQEEYDAKRRELLEKI